MKSVNDLVSKGPVKLDLAKYGLSHLEGIGLESWADFDVDKLIKAFATENIAPCIFEFPFTEENVEKLLSKSYCRRCGSCCLPDPRNPEHPGVIVSELDLRMIARHTRHSYKFLKKKAKLNQDPRWARRRYLPLPCIFYEKGRCKIYEIRPFVCRTYPVTDMPGQAGVKINLKCEYGVDIYKSMIRHVRTGKPDHLF